MGIDELRARADRNPGDVAAQIAAAYACDREGLEGDAVGYYDAAHALGVTEQRERFLVGYGSTLRNVGRLDDSLAILDAAIAELPRYCALRLFRALTLHSLGRSAEAVASVIEIAIEIAMDAAPESLDGYDRALREYVAELIDPPAG
jgi:tetratricopeptide (TPR) repeat protein